MGLPIEIVGGETLRADDGLALSSRNGYLSEDERAEAVQISASLRVVRERTLALRATGDLNAAAVAELQTQAMTTLSQRGWAPDYVLLRRQRDLLPALNAELAASEPLVVLAAAKLGKTRLIDNIEV